MTSNTGKHTFLESKHCCLDKKQMVEKEKAELNKKSLLKIWILDLIYLYYICI